MTIRWIALSFFAALFLALNYHGVKAGFTNSESRQAERSTCEAPKLWTNPEPEAECYQKPVLCPEGHETCDRAPRLWTNARPSYTMDRL